MNRINWPDGRASCEKKHRLVENHRKTWHFLCHHLAARDGLAANCPAGLVVWALKEDGSTNGGDLPGGKQQHFDLLSVLFTRTQILPAWTAGRQGKTRVF